MLIMRALGHELYKGLGYVGNLCTFLSIFFGGRGNRKLFYKIFLKRKLPTLPKHPLLALFPSFPTPLSCLGALILHSPTTVTF